MPLWDRLLYKDSLGAISADLLTCERPWHDRNRNNRRLSKAGLGFAALRGASQWSRTLETYGTKGAQEGTRVTHSVEFRRLGLDALGPT
jgi:hypothetical protein